MEEENWEIYFLKPITRVVFLIDDLGGIITMFLTSI
jgi:hypothetical protein